MDGAVKFFYHSPSSALPVPDILGEVMNPKTEYHPLSQDLFAENWIKECQQRTIRRLVDQGLEYLFWVTSCNDRSSSQYRAQLVVGYLALDASVERPTWKDGRIIRQHLAVIGRPVIVSFDDALSTRTVLGGTYNRPRFIHDPFVEKGVGSMLRHHFDSRVNIAERCAREIELLRRRLPTV